MDNPGKFESVDAVFGGYTGKKRFMVSHSTFKRPLTVAAPDEDAAMVAAAEHEGIRWQSYSYYPHVTVTRVG